jgi:hypothetical protein
MPIDNDIQKLVDILDSLKLKKKIKQQTRKDTKQAIKDLPHDVLVHISNFASPKTKKNIAMTNKQIRQDIKASTQSYARKNGDFLLKFLQNLDNYIPKDTSLRYDKNGFSKNLFTLYAKTESVGRYEMAVVRLYKKPGEQKRVMVFSTSSQYVRPRENIELNYTYENDNKSFKGTKITQMMISDTHERKLFLHLLLGKLEGIAFYTPLSSEMKSKEYNPISEDKLLKEWYDFIFYNKP